MKILILSNGALILYKFRRELLEKLMSDGHDLYVSVPDDEFVPDLKEMGCNIIETELSRRGINPLEDFHLMCRYHDMMKIVKPDIVLTYTIKPNIYGGLVCAKNQVPYIVNITGLGTSIENKGILQLLTVNMYRQALKNAQTVFFQNKENELFFAKKKLALGKHRLLPGSGVNLSFYEPIEYPKSETIDFLFVARIMKEKGVDHYFDAACAIHKKYPQTRFHICGFFEQAYEDKIKKLQAEGIIIYHGFVREMKDMYKQIRCTIHPSYMEGLSNALLESAASARPIITTNRPGCREVIEDGKSGFLVKAGDSQDVIEKVETFIHLSWEEQRQMGLAGRKKVEAEFNRQIIVDAYIDSIQYCIHK